jgi:hypothetical protein
MADDKQDITEILTPIHPPNAYLSKSADSEGIPDMK